MVINEYVNDNDKDKAIIVIHEIYGIKLLI